MTKKSVRKAFAATAVAVAVAGAAVVGGQITGGTSNAKAATDARAAAAANDWPNFGNTPDNTRYSTLSQVNTKNVAKLGLAFTVPEGKNVATWETYPVEVGGTLYITTNTDQVIAMDATNGKVKWKYTPKVKFYLAVAGGGGGVATNRGVVVADGKVFMQTFDNQLTALQSSTGELLWKTEVANPDKGYSETSPPTYANGKLIVGSAESDAGLRGFVASYDAKTGKQDWRFFLVPAPGQGWMPKAGEHGGGDVWMPPVVKDGTVYVGTGNPSPDLNNAVRPGCNPWVDATVAINAATGKFKWGRTEVCPDVWDYDSHQPPMLFNVKQGGKTVAAVGQGNKEGKFFVLERATGKVLHVSPWLVKENSHPKPTAKGVLVCPGAIGGLEYSPAAYSPDTGAAYEAGINECMTYRLQPTSQTNAHTAGQVDFGGSFTPDGKKITGTMSAIDTNTGKLMWHKEMPGAMVGGVLATKGGLVFSGSDNNHFYAFDAKTGKILWHPNLGLAFGAAPMTYSVGGVQYIAIAAGGANVASLTGGTQGGTLAVFKLNGKPIHKLPAVKGTSVPSASQYPNLASYKQISPNVYVSAAKKAVVMKAIAALTPANSGFNFNGYSKGKATLTVPVGWTVTYEFSNNSAVPHSLAITKNVKGKPNVLTSGLGAPLETANATAGVRKGVKQLFSFAVTQPGTYYMACLVPGHLAAGMYDDLVVSKTATSASFKGSK
jgi:alcohol dehydrogenase (cytochrome c)